MNNELACFFCTTPYQIISAISIVQHESIDADIYIINQFLKSEELAEEIDEKDIFHSVYYIDESRYYGWFRKRKSKLLTYFGLLKCYLDIDSIVDSIIARRKYKSLYASSKALTGRLVFLYYCKHNLSAEYHYFDDGIDSYIKPLSRDARKVDAICRRLIFGRKALNVKYDLILYSPELYYMLNNHSIIVNKLNTIDKNEQNSIFLSNCYFRNTSSHISEICLILDTIREIELNVLGCREIDKIYGEISEIIGENNLIYKTHPRSQQDRSLKVTDREGIPLEAFCYFNDYSDKIFITIKSTAAFTPKLLFNQEPTIIFLYKLLENNILNLQPKMDDLCIAVKSIYNNPEKVCIPSSDKELKQILHSLIEEKLVKI